MTTTSANIAELGLKDDISIGLQVSSGSRQQNIANSKQRRNTILKELPISVDDLTEEDITLYAKQIGIDPCSEPDLLWIARKGLVSKLPFPWIAVEDQRGRLYYFNCETEQSCWEHPCDHYYRSLAEQQRLKGSSTTLSMSGLTSIANLHFVDEDLGFKSEGNGNGNQSDKKSTQIDTKLNKGINESLKRNNNDSDEEVESVDFELEVEEALEELSSNGAEHDEELVTIDVTEGSNYDTKQFKEVHTIELNSSDDRVVNNDFKYRIDKNISKADVSETNSSDVMKDKMQNKRTSVSSLHTSNIKQSSTGSKSQTVKDNEVSVSDEFLLDVSEDPFAEFDAYDQNYNDLFGSLGNTGMPSKYDNSDNYEERTSAKPLSNHNQSTAQTTHKTHKPLETLEETSERDENGLESVGTNSVRDEELVEDEEEAQEEKEEEESLNGVEGNEIHNNIYENNDDSNGLQIEYKFEEITNSLTEKIASLRSELREEIRKQRNTINKEMRQQMNGLDNRVNKNSEALSDTKSELTDLRQIITKNMSQKHTSAVTVTEKSVDIDKIEKEMQLLRTDVRNESIESIRELRNELNRDIKSKVNSAFGDLEMKFMDYKDESNREIRDIRNELKNVSNNSKNFGQQTNELKDDLSQTLAAIEKQRKEYNKRMEKLDIDFSEETQRFHTEVQRLQTLMKKIENKVQELDSESNEIQLLSRLERNEVTTTESKARIDSIDNEIKHLAQQVLNAFKASGQKTNTTEAKDENQKNIVVKEPNREIVVEKEVGVEQTPQQNSGAIDDNSQPINMTNRMSTIEEKIKNICDSFERMIPIINKNLSQNRNSYYSRKRQDMSRSKVKSIGKQRHSDEDDYMSRTSSSLLSSSSISEPKLSRPESTGKRRQMYRRAVPQSMHKSIANKTDIHSVNASHKCCIHRDSIQSDYYLPERNYQMIKVPLVSTPPHWERQQHLKHIKSSSSSLLNLIKKTTKKLREEAMELEGLGNYRFVTDFETTLPKEFIDGDRDEAAIKRLKSVRLDVDQKLRKLTSVINQQKSSQI